MSKKHKNRRPPQHEEARREVAVEVSEGGEMHCTDRSNHWENILIYGQCARCQRAFSPFVV